MTATDQHIPTGQSRQAARHTTGPWPVPTWGVSTPVFLLALIAGALLWLGLIVAGQDLLCRVDPQGHSYCSDYQPITNEETR
jgi:hypothetical protein